MNRLIYFMALVTLPFTMFGYADFEEAYMSMDKPFYLQGETAWFSVFSFDSKTRVLLPGTRFMELTLINDQGTIISQHHLKIDGGRAFGQIDFSSELTAGNYMLVLGYASEPVENYIYRRLVRLYSSNVEDYGASLKNIEVSGESPSENLEKSSMSGSKLILTTNGTVFKKRSKVELTLEANASVLRDLELSMVIRKKAISTFDDINIQSIDNSGNQNNLAKQVGFANSRKNRPITFNAVEKHGSLLFELDKLEGPDETSVNSTFMVGEQQEVLLFKNEQGRFVLDASNLNTGLKTLYFNHFHFLPYSDNRYRYVRKRWMNGGELKLSWAKDDRDFSKVLPQGINSPLEVTREVREYVIQKDLRDKIAKAFGSGDLVIAGEQDERYVPSDWFNVADYSVMADLPEFLREVVSGLRYTDKDGVKDFRFSYPGDKYRGMPFILVDNIPTIDANKVLNIPLDDIEGVGVLKDLTTDTKLARQNRSDLEQFGYFGKNGILFIKLKNNVSNPFLEEFKNMPSRELIMESRKYDGPAYVRPGAKNGMPDFRPVLYWEPQLKLLNGKATVSFYTSDDAGEYEISVEGIAGNGEIINARKVIEIGGGSEN